MITSWLDVAAKSVLLFACLTMLLTICKTLRGKRGALNVAINLDDLLVLLLATFALTLAQLMLVELLFLSLFLCIYVYGFLVWLDALLFVQYRIEINRQTLSWFISGSKGISKGIPHLFQGLAKFPAAGLVPVLWLACLWIYAFHSHKELLFLLALSSLVVFFSHLPRLAAILVVGLNSVMLTQLYATNTTGQYVLVIAGGAFATMCVLLMCLRVFFSSAHPFLTSPTLLGNILLDDSFELDDTQAIKAEHERFVRPKPQAPEPSELFGSLKGANVILITVESLGAYVAPYANQLAKSRLAERFKDNSWISEQHFCLCPNTTVSTNQIYSGAYSNNPYNKSDSIYPGVTPRHIETLKNAGYSTLFLDSADIGLYDYYKLLAQIGFDHVWGTNDIPANGLKEDYRLLNMIDEIVEVTEDKPFFLHLINDQTHMPYEIVNKSRFNRHKGQGAKSEYLNAVEEVDYIIDQFLSKLADKIDLSDTIIVFTGDHGESFGEYGYSFHSNSIIQPQMQVPFMLNHPILGAKKISHSCHFDLFPTFFDLLGIDCPYQTLGKSIAHDDREFAYFFHSATLKGNSPANFGFMLDGELIWMDRLFNQVNIVTPGQNRQKANTQEKHYAKILLHSMLKHREILS